ncbi:MAG: hypothetical protein R8G01_01325 [Ilumatobacteraceae bacterium]|nr:hypothetical protein [Ilumatobacteraceae bacterium]
MNERIEPEYLAELTEIGDWEDLPVMPAWGATPMKYTSMHWALRKFYGPASEHRCVDCGEAAHHWSLIVLGVVIGAE